MTRLLHTLHRVGLSFLALLLLAINLRIYFPNSGDYKYNRLGPDVVPQLRYVRQALDAGAGEEMQGLFPEGYFFSYALYGLAWVEAGLREPHGSALHAEALRESHWALDRVDSPAGRAPFPAALDPPFGVFYNGWAGWLRGGVLKLQPPETRDPLEVTRFGADCAALAAAFDRGDTPFLQAYHGGAWPVDSVVAVAALRLHDSLLPPRFEQTVQRWLRQARSRLDPATGLLPHRVDPMSGAMLDGTRGSSQSVIARFLTDIDEGWGREQYATFRRLFATTVFGVPGIREYPPGMQGEGDVDSGPLFAGISLSSSVVTLGAALAQGDAALAGPLLNTGEALGMPLEWGGGKRYAFGVLPVGDAFLAWAKSARPWIAPPADAQLPEVVAWWWRLPIHLVSLALLALASLPLWLRHLPQLTSFRSRRGNGVRVPE